MPMKTIEGYSKEKYTDSSVLLAGGGAKALSDFVGTLTWDGTNKKIKYTPIGGNATDLVTLSWSNISGKPDSFTPSSHNHALSDINSGFGAAYRLIYSTSATATATLAANTTTTKKFLTMTGTGSAGAAPSWGTVTWDDVGSKPDSFTPSSHTHDAYVPKISGTGSVVATKTSTYGWAGCKIRIPGGYNSYMIALTLRIYSSYNYTDIVCSGYHYGSNHWYMPNAQIIGGTQRFQVVMGYEGDTDNHLYIWFGYKEGNLGYGGFSIMNLHSGHSAGPDWYSDWTISNVGYSSLTNKQYDASPVLPSMDGHTHDYAASNHNHNSSYVSSLSTSGNYLTWDKNGTTNNITVPYATSAGSAASATTATNLANNPSIQAGTSDTNKVTITAGGKTSSEFTIPYAANAGALGSYSASDLIYCGARNLAPPSWCGVRNSSSEYIHFGDPTTIYQTWGLGWYTISFDIKTDVAGSGDLYATPGYGRYVFSQQSITTTTSWTHKVFRINVSDNNNGQGSSISIYLTYGSGAIIHVRNFKMEKGKIETTFSYAPEYYINTDNIGSQSVNYAATAGSASYADSAGSASSATTADKVANSITFKNTAGTSVSFNGSVAKDLTSGVNYAAGAGEVKTVKTEETVSYYPTFVETNNNSAALQNVYTNKYLKYYANSGELQCKHITLTNDGALSGGLWVSITGGNNNPINASTSATMFCIYATNSYTHSNTFTANGAVIGACGSGYHYDILAPWYTSKFGGLELGVESNPVDTDSTSVSYSQKNSIYYVNSSKTVYLPTTYARNGRIIFVINDGNNKVTFQAPGKTIKYFRRSGSGSATGIYSGERFQCIYICIYYSNTWYIAPTDVTD